MKLNTVLMTLTKVALLAACAAQDPSPPESTATAVEQPVVTPQDPVDELLLRAGRSSPAEAADLRLEAASRLLERNEAARAEDAIAPLARARLAPLQGARYAWVLARLDLARSDPAAALARLSDAAVLANAGADRVLKVDITRARAQALLATDQALPAAEELAALQPWLVADTDREANARALLQALAGASYPELGAAMETAGAEDWRAWLELSAIVRDLSATPAGQREKLRSWRARYQSLAALETVSRAVIPEVESRIANPARVAILLPLTGRAATSGQAVLHGYLAERFRQAQAGDLPPVAAVIDTAVAAGGFPAAYRRAVSDGAAFVVGPLLKEELAAFSSGLEAAVPTLALNFLDDGPPAQERLLLFGIDIDDELRQLVRSARGAGYQRVTLLTGNDERLRRLATNLQDEWRRAGGEVIDTLHLQDLNEYRESLESSLLLSQSAARSEALRRTLGIAFATEPRRRADLDLFIVLAEPPDARSIRSLLTYLYAGDVPVWGTSMTRAHGEQPGNLDLEGMRFVDMPWYSLSEAVLRADSTAAVAAGPMERLFALGADAFRLQSRLGLLAWSPSAGLRGATGELSVGAGSRIRRHSEWYLVQDGHAEPLVPLAGPVVDSDSTEGDASWIQDPGAAGAPPRPAPL